MITIKAKQKLFTHAHAEAARLTGICAQHLNNFAKLRRLGFIARPNEAARIENEQRLFTTWDITVLVTLFSRCTHYNKSHLFGAQERANGASRRTSIFIFGPIRP
jgi:hypothetical protein